MGNKMAGKHVTFEPKKEKHGGKYENKETNRKRENFCSLNMGKKELGIDMVCILTDVIILTGLPLFYEKLPEGIGRIITVLILLAAMLAVTVWTIIRLVRRNKERKLEKRDYLFVGLRSLIVAAAVWIFAYVMVKVIHPSLTGIYEIEMAEVEQIKVLIFNSLFFVLCSQAFLTIFTGTEEKREVFYKRLLKTWVITILPMFLMTAVFTVLAEWLKGIDLFISHFFNIILTTFLWVTSIAINENT